MSGLKGWVSQIQHGSEGDGPGLRTTVFLSGCSLRCSWCHNPETWEQLPKLMFFPALCSHCGVCAQVCPESSHLLEGNSHRVLRDRCGGPQKVPCGRCAALCPSSALRLSTCSMTIGQVMEEIQQDRDFYLHSGGGVTLSGGEPLLQPAFCAELAKACCHQGIPVLLDTAGDVPWSSFQQVIPYTRQVYYDVKTACQEDCRHFTGGNYQQILDNLSRLLQEKRLVTVRIPLIPGVNWEEDTLLQIGETLRKVGAREVSLLPFHRLGSSKYAALDMEYSFSSCPPPEKKEVEHRRKLLADLGLSVWIGG